MFREIDTRQNHGITVTLWVNFQDTFWDAGGKPTHAKVEVSGIDEFTINDIPLDKASDVFFHPFAYGSNLLASGRLERV